MAKIKLDDFVPNSFEELKAAHRLLNKYAIMLGDIVQETNDNMHHDFLSVTNGETEKVETYLEQYRRHVEQYKNKSVSCLSDLLVELVRVQQSVVNGLHCYEYKEKIKEKI